MSERHFGPIRAHTGCGKTGYSKRGAADRAKRMRRRLGEALQEYRCRQCQAWHVGHAT